jgi:hypothetical protein
MVRKTTLGLKDGPLINKNRKFLSSEDRAFRFTRIILRTVVLKDGEKDSLLE